MGAEASHKYSFMPGRCKMKERSEVYWPLQPLFFLAGTLSMWYIHVSGSPKQWLLTCSMFWLCQKAPKNSGKNAFENEPSTNPYMEAGCSQHTAQCPGGKPGALPHVKDNPIFMTELYQPGISQVSLVLPLWPEHQGGISYYRYWTVSP